MKKNSTRKVHIYLATLVLLATAWFTAKKAIQPVKDFTILSETISQPKDHNEEKGASFEQRIKILIPDDVEPNPAVLFILGNESAINDDKIANLYKAYGKRKDMILLNAEHRGYGESVTNDSDQTVPLYVNVQQALTDYHAVVEKYRSRYSGDWIAAGYSYGGGLSINFGYKYPQDVQAVLSSSGVIDWSFLLDTYDIQAKENLGEAFYKRLVNHAVNLKPLKPFDQNWKDRELIYAYVTGLSQYEGYNKRYKDMISLLSYLPTKQFISTLRFIDEKFSSSSANEYAISNAKQTLSREEALSGIYEWRVWRYQQFFETGTLWKSPQSEGLYQNTLEDWIQECEFLFGEAPPLLKSDKWKVDEMVDKLHIPLIYVNGGKDPWKRVCLPKSYKIKNGTYVYFEDGYHCPDRELSGRDAKKRGEKVIEEVFRYINRG